MKKHRCYKLLFLLIILLPLKMFAQQQPDITGLWKGELYDDTTQKYIPYDLAISEENGKLTGYSYAVFTTDSSKEYGLKKIKIKRKDDNNIIIEDVEMISDNYSVVPSKRVKKLLTLKLEVQDSVMTLTGKWKTNWTKEYHPVTGSVQVKRRNDSYKEVKEEPMLKKLGEMKLSNELSFVKTEEQKIAANTKPVIAAEKKQDVIVTVKPTKKEEAIAKDSTLVALAKIKNEIKEQKKREDIARKDSIETVIAKAKEEKKRKDSIETAVARSVKEKKKADEAIAQKEKQKQKEEVKQAPVAKKEVVASKPVIVAAAAEASKRKTATIRTIEYNTDSLLFTLYDNGIVDGDTVSVLMNGNLIFSKEGLSDKPITKTIYTKDIPDSLSLVLYAESLGTIPPNTGLLIIQEGKTRNEIYFSADLEHNAAITLQRKKKE